MYTCAKNHSICINGNISVPIIELVELLEAHLCQNHTICINGSTSVPMIELVELLEVHLCQKAYCLY